MSLLRVTGLSKGLGRLEILKDIHLEVEPGERHAIIGPNGAGKTTLFNCLTGVVRADAGTVMLDGRDITRLPPHHRARLGLSRTFQRNNLFLELTVERNVELAILSGKAYRWNVVRALSDYPELAREAREWLERWGLVEYRSRLVTELSYGEQRRLEILLAMAQQPRILLLDEPTSGMSPAETQETVQIIQGLPRSMALLVVEHDMDVVFSIADRITVLHHGRVVARGSCDEIRNDPRVAEIYFGGGALRRA